MCIYLFRIRAPKFPVIYLHFWACYAVLPKFIKLDTSIKIKVYIDLYAVALDFFQLKQTNKQTNTQSTKSKNPKQNIEKSITF